ncbi:dienelactone hydrolase family protein [Mesobacillus foraminis]|uniref:alpha/beta hydrolase family protein n=1 Tax=Mesobacillus foraminis TaxID=279826 RepID=UPI001BEBFFFB|nr:alpha/beta hydrolase family protein [Mesobacillus foraminis]MBT2757825.1 dienelactone hydrolase family protein [Mesobacillus foraminis]
MDKKLLPDDFFESIYYNATKQTEFNSLEDRRRFVSEGLSKLLGDFSKEVTDLPLEKPDVLETVEYNTYIRERVIFKTAKNLYSSMYVLTPKHVKGGQSAVLALHGHGYGNKEVVGLTELGEDDQQSAGIHQHFAIQLVRRGLKVFAPEIIGFGDRLLSIDNEQGKPSSCDLMTRSLLMAGKTLAGLRVAEAIRTLDIIETYPDVIKANLGIMGFSGGGLIAAYTSALDTRLKATVLCGFTNTFKGSILSMRHCVDNYVPGLLNVAELPELIGLIAPRSLFVESGRNDTIFPVDHFEDAVSFLQHTYEKVGASNAFHFDLFDGVHEISGRKSYDWLKKQLTE